MLSSGLRTTTVTWLPAAAAAVALPARVGDRGARRRRLSRPERRRVDAWLGAVVVDDDDGHRRGRPPPPASAGRLGRSRPPGGDASGARRPPGSSSWRRARAPRRCRASRNRRAWPCRRITRSRSRRARGAEGKTIPKASRRRIDRLSGDRAPQRQRALLGAALRLPFSSYDVETAARLSSQPARGDEVSQDGRRPVLVVADLVVQARRRWRAPCRAR